ncbi:short-chain dehydrogenase, putative [Paecilomyces variotii No. 5]|uniref:Short-chain dehydrogenase, putative n=1 Tax=Byssochlamys spectabilis (strain No. 5 / NBRC 109023) TaxID=1356009 RepID=V5HWM8_BYSSN|nr:short-chain dehydrogenase, putative [Paecilomyces variotii No. 5]
MNDDKRPKPSSTVQPMIKPGRYRLAHSCLSRAIYTVRDSSSTHLAHQASNTTHAYEVLLLELSSLASIRAAAATINARVTVGEIPPIRALILNAGCQEMDTQRFTDNGFATMFAVNYLGNWLLTLLLLQSMDRENGRIAVLGSKAHDPSLKENARMFNDERWKTILRDSTDPIAKGTWSSPEEDPSWMSGMRRYGASKLCAIMMMYWGTPTPSLHRSRFSNVSILGVDLGTVPTNIARCSPFFIRVLMFKVIFPVIAALQAWRNPSGNNGIRTAHKAAGDVLAAALDSSPVLGEWPKGLYLDGAKRAEVSPEAKGEKKRLMLWKDSVRYTELKREETMLVNWD